MSGIQPTDKAQVNTTQNLVKPEPKVSAIGHIIKAIKNPVAAMKKIGQTFSSSSESTEITKPIHQSIGPKAHQMQLKTLSEINREDIQLCDEAKDAQVMENKNVTADERKSCGNTLWRINQYAFDLRNCYLRLKAEGEENPQFLKSIQEKKTILTDELNRRLEEAKGGNTEYGPESKIQEVIVYTARMTSHIPSSS